MVKETADKWIALSRLFVFFCLLFLCCFPFLFFPSPPSVPPLYWKLQQTMIAKGFLHWYRSWWLLQSKYIFHLIMERNWTEFHNRKFTNGINNQSKWGHHFPLWWWGPEVQQPPLLWLATWQGDCLYPWPQSGDLPHAAPVQWLRLCCQGQFQL